MRSFIVMAMFVASFANASWLNYTEVRELDADASGAQTLVIDAGAGSLIVRGGASTNTVHVRATIRVDESNDDKARELIEAKLRLSLTSEGDRLRLQSLFEHGQWFGGISGTVDLEVTMPDGIALRIDDGSGSIQVETLAADVTIDDGSGSIKVTDVGALRIDDGSGSIDVQDAAGDVVIVDGSGSITVVGVAGSVKIDDGSGSIKVEDVEEDLIIGEDGSGGLSVTNVRGEVELDT